MDGDIVTLHPTASPEELTLIEGILLEHTDIKKDLEKKAFLIQTKGVLIKYKTKEQLREKIFSYFHPGINSDTGKPTNRSIVSIGGLAVHLGITRKTLIEYGQDKEYGKIIKDAKEMISAQIAEMGMSKQLDASFTKFYMKNNHGRTDKHELETTTTEKKTFEINIVQPSPIPIDTTKGE